MCVCARSFVIVFWHAIKLVFNLEFHHLMLHFLQLVFTIVLAFVILILLCICVCVCAAPTEHTKFSFPRSSSLLFLSMENFIYFVSCAPDASMIFVFLMANTFQGKKVNFSFFYLIYFFLFFVFSHIFILMYFVIAINIFDRLLLLFLFCLFFFPPNKW